MLMLRSIVWKYKMYVLNEHLFLTKILVCKKLCCITFKRIENENYLTHTQLHVFVFLILSPGVTHASYII